MIHATYGRPPQHFGPTQRHSVRRAKDVINAAVVDGSLPRIAPQVAKIFQEIRSFAASPSDVRWRLCPTVRGGRTSQGLRPKFAGRMSQAQSLVNSMTNEKWKMRNGKSAYCWLLHDHSAADG
jgi:hypothetical protein